MIEGESQDAKHKSEIDVESWSWSESNVGDAAHRGGMGAGKVHMQDFHFVMKINKASPKLMLACATGEHIKKAILTCRKAGKAQLLRRQAFKAATGSHNKIMPLGRQTHERS